jgi:glutamine amidotransferase PdxT
MKPIHLIMAIIVGLMIWGGCAGLMLLVMEVLRDLVQR